MDKQIEKVLEEAEAEGGVDLGVNPQNDDDMEGSSTSADAKEDVSESSTEETLDETSSEDANTPAEESKDVPFHEHPRFKEIVSTNRDLKNQNKELSDKLNQTLGRLDEISKRSIEYNDQESLTPEQVQAKEQLIDMLGLRGVTDKLAVLERQNQELTQKQIDQAFDKEEEILTSRISEFGLAKDNTDMDQIRDELESYIDQHPILKNSKNQPGVWTLAFNDLYVNNGKLLELGKRSANKEEIKRQKAIKSNQTENRSKPNKAEKNLKGSVLQKTIQLMEEAGEIDFTS